MFDELLLCNILTFSAQIKWQVNLSPIALDSWNVPCPLPTVKCNSEGFQSKNSVNFILRSENLICFYHQWGEWEPQFQTNFTVKIEPREELN